MIYDGLDATALAARLGVSHLVLLERVTSTLDVAHELGRDGAPHGTIVLADEQVAGRGRDGRRWQSPPGVGIWLAYLLRPRTARPCGVEVLSLRVGLALVDAFREVGARVRIKWPNDLILGHRKLGGILCEGRWRGDLLEWMAIGIGLNVHGPLASEVAATAIPLDETVPGLRRVTVLDAILRRLPRLEVGTRLHPAELEAYAAADWLENRRLAEPVPGVVRGIEETGALIVEDLTGTRQSVRSGHVVPA